MLKIKPLIYGVLLSALISIVAIIISFSSFFQNIGISALVLVILLGMVVGNTFYQKIKPACQSGINFTKHYFLRAGIILYGFRLTLLEIENVGVRGVLIDAIMLTITFGLTFFLAIKFFKLDPQTSALIGAGASICGAAAVMATAPIVTKDANKVAIAMATVVVFGTIAIFIYPMIFYFLQSNNIDILTNHQFATYIGSSVHEVAQVVAIGNVLSSDIENIAVIEKMIRVMMLAPFLLALSYFWQRNSSSEKEKGKIVIPWFALFFIIVICFNTLNLLPKSLVSIIIDIDGFLLTMAMGALGVTTSIGAIKEAGFKPFLLGFIIFIWLIFGGLFINSVI